MRRATLAVCLALIPTGCGSAGEGSEPLSADAYRAQVSSICRNAQTKEPGTRDRIRATDADELARLDSDTKTRMNAYLAEFEAIVPPQELEPDATEFVLVSRDSVKHWGDYLDASREGTPEEVEAALIAGSESAKRSNALVAALNIPDCATPDSFTAYGWQPAP
jgi:hypothetical protein